MILRPRDREDECCSECTCWVSEPVGRSTWWMNSAARNGLGREQTSYASAAEKNRFSSILSGGLQYARTTSLSQVRAYITPSRDHRPQHVGNNFLDLSLVLFSSFLPLQTDWNVYFSPQVRQKHWHLPCNPWARQDGWGPPSREWRRWTAPQRRSQVIQGFYIARWCK